MFTRTELKGLHGHCRSILTVLSDPNQPSWEWKCGIIVNVIIRYIYKYGWKFWKQCFYEI